MDLRTFLEIVDIEELTAWLKKKKCTEFCDKESENQLMGAKKILSFFNLSLAFSLSNDPIISNIETKEILVGSRKTNKYSWEKWELDILLDCKKQAHGRSDEALALFREKTIDNFIQRSDASVKTKIKQLGESL